MHMHECERTIYGLYTSVGYLQIRSMRRHAKQCLNCGRRGTIYFQIRSCIHSMYVLITLILHGPYLRQHLRPLQQASMSIQSSCWRLGIHLCCWQQLQ